jgi:hypothetical protein
MVKQIIVVLTWALALSIIAQAQESARPQPEERPISLKLSVESAKVCLGSLVPLTLTMTNRSDRELTISKLDVWRNFYFEYLASDGSKKTIGYLVSPGRMEDYVRLRDDIFSLKPDATYTTSFRFPLGDPRHFEYASMYTLKLYYKDLANSNFVSFETYDCNSH